jgi:phosphoribosylanthranilate isomerase
MTAVHVKVCGVTNVEDALACLALGVSSIGLNFVEESPRRVDEATARAIVQAVDGRALVVGVVADESVAAMVSLRERLGLGCLQLHGDEPPSVLTPLLPHAYKALRIGDATDVARADEYGGRYLLVDAKVAGQRGGTGVRLDPSLVASLARRRRLSLAGGLRAENVGEAIAIVRPWCVDVASGVEVDGDPRRKDRERLARFMAAVASAPARLDDA